MTTAVTAALAATPRTLDALAHLAAALRRDEVAQRITARARAARGDRRLSLREQRARDRRLDRVLDELAAALDQGRLGRLVGSLLRLGDLGLDAEELLDAVELARVILARVILEPHREG